MVSALLPVKNGAATLDEALESLYRQTRPLAECLVIDDGSTDATGRILSDWLKRWPRLRVLKSPGSGIASALNAGLASASGSWIARMDADDRCDPRRIERQLETARADAALALVSCRVTHGAVDAGLQQQGMQRHIEWADCLERHDELEQALWVDSPLPHPTWLVHRRAFEAVGHYDASAGVPEDYEWLHRFFFAALERPDLRARKLAGEPLLEWRDWPTRLTRTSPAYSEAAFNEVKTTALARRLERSRPSAIHVFGLGPKSKALFPELAARLARIDAIVEVHPRRLGIRYQGVPVIGVEEWKSRVLPDGTFVVICLGTPETRRASEQLCLEAGLSPGRDFVAL